MCILQPLPSIPLFLYHLHNCELDIGVPHNIHILSFFRSPFWLCSRSLAIEVRLFAHHDCLNQLQLLKDRTKLMIPVLISIVVSHCA